MSYRIIGRRGFSAYDAPRITAGPYGGGGTYVADLVRDIRQARSRPMVVNQPPTQARDLVIGFSSLGVAAGATVDVTQRPQVVFKPERIVVAATNAASFTIDDIKIGNKSQLVANGTIPAEAFTQGAFGVTMSMDTCDISQDFILEVTNTSAGALDFYAAVFGKAVY